MVFRLSWVDDGSHHIQKNSFDLLQTHHPINLKLEEPRVITKRDEFFVGLENLLQSSVSFRGHFVWNIFTDGIHDETLKTKDSIKMTMMYFTKSLWSLLCSWLLFSAFYHETDKKEALLVLLCLIFVNNFTQILKHELLENTVESVPKLNLLAPSMLRYLLWLF